MKLSSEPEGKEERMDFGQIGKYLCFILRHHPEEIGITLDEHGWADVDELLAGISEQFPLRREQLEEIVRTDAKNRYSFSADGQLIRCNQGHSIPVDVELEQVLPPVQTGKMAEDGYAFYRSLNGVWLTEAVPAKYLEKMK